MSVGVATVGDIDELVALAPRMLANAAAALGPINELDWRAALLAIIDDGGGRVFVARSDGRITGALVTTRGALAFNTGVVVCHILTLWVSPEARGAGTARTMLDAATEWARQIGAVAMVAGVPLAYDGQHSLGDVCSPSRAIAVYKASGFAPVETSMIKAVR